MDPQARARMQAWNNEDRFYSGIDLHYDRTNSLWGAKGWENDPASLRKAAQILLDQSARIWPSMAAGYKYGACRALARAAEIERGFSGRTKPADSAPRSVVAAKPAPKAAPPAAKLPPARPAKMAPWSPKAMSTKPESKLSPRYAAERADALASCSVAIRQLAAYYPQNNLDEAILMMENWLDDASIDTPRGKISQHIATLDAEIQSASHGPARKAGLRAGRCLNERRLTQLDGSPLLSGAVDGTLTPLSIGGQTPPWTQQGKDARIIASDGKSAMDCVKLVELTKTDSRMGGGGRVLSNQCSGPVEIVWCINPGECDRERGNMWTVRAGGSWPVSANGEVRWAACHGANTAAHVKGTFGLRYYCSAPAKK